MVEGGGSGFEGLGGEAGLPGAPDAGGPKRMPLHQRGVTAEPGLSFIGLPWLHKWKSAFLFGADEDAAHLATHIAQGRHAG